MEIKEIDYEKVMEVAQQVAELIAKKNLSFSEIQVILREAQGILENIPLVISKPDQA